MTTKLVRSTALAVLLLAGCSGATGGGGAPIALAPAAGQRSFFETGAPGPGWSPRQGTLFQLDAGTHRGSEVRNDAVVPFSWSTATGLDVIVTYDQPRTIGFQSRAIGESPAPPDVQSAYRASYGEWINVRVDLVARRWQPVSRQGDTYRIGEVQTEALTWGPFSVNGQSYEYASQQTETYPVQLRERAASPAVPWTPALAAATWALDAYYAPAGTSYLYQQPMWPDYNGDVVTLAPGGAGESRYTGRTLQWAIAGGYLDLVYSDGSTERLEIVDGGGDVYGVWSEHRDATGALVSGWYDWAFRTLAPPPATAAAFVTGSSQFWEQFVSAWSADAWNGSDLKWDWNFGWQLLADGTGANVEAFYDVAPGGAQTPVFSMIPLTWSITDTGQLRIDRRTLSTGENSAYRLFTPMATTAGRVYGIEEEYRRLAADAAYEVYIAPRLTAYERRAIPPSTP